MLNLNFLNLYKLNSLNLFQNIFHNCSGAFNLISSTQNNNLQVYNLVIFKITFSTPLFHFLLENTIYVENYTLKYISSLSIHEIFSLNKRNKIFFMNTLIKNLSTNSKGGFLKLYINNLLNINSLLASFIQAKSGGLLYMNENNTGYIIEFIVMSIFVKEFGGIFYIFHKNKLNISTISGNKLLSAQGSFIFIYTNNYIIMKKIICKNSSSTKRAPFMICNNNNFIDLENILIMKLSSKSEGCSVFNHQNEILINIFYQKYLKSEDSSMIFFLVKIN